MENQRQLYTVLILGLFLILFVLIVTNFLIQKATTPKNKTIFPLTPKPTLSIITITPISRFTPIITYYPTGFNILQTPTSIPPTSTGAKDEIPKEEIDLSQQKLDLMNKLPLKTDQFTIDFDYNQDRFLVNLSLPKTENKVHFDQWLKENYPAIPYNLFLFK